MKKYIIGFITGAVVFGCLGAYAYSIASKDVEYDNTNSSSSSTNVQGAIDELYDKVNSGEGYVAIFSGTSSINTTEIRIPNTYISSDYGYIDGNGDMVITKAGEYQVVATLAHSPVNNTYSSFLKAYLNNQLITDGDDYNCTYISSIGTVSAFNTGSGGYNILATTISVQANSVLKVTYISDGNITGLRGGTLILISK